MSGTQKVTTRRSGPVEWDAVLRCKRRRAAALAAVRQIPHTPQVMKFDGISNMRNSSLIDDICGTDGQYHNVDKLK